MLHPDQIRGETTDSVSRDKDMSFWGPNQTTVVTNLTHTIISYFPRLSTADAHQLVSDSFRQADLRYGLETAAAWANGFRIPWSQVEQDVHRFKAAGNSIVALATTLRQERSSDRLTPERVERMVSPLNPDYARIHRLASHGIEVILGPDFVPSGIDGRPPLRAKYRDAGGAVDRMVYDAFLSTNLAVALPISLLEHELLSKDSLNFSASSWATKYGKECGRNVVDCRDGGTGSGLNSKAVKAMADTLWERIHHPTLLTIVHMILDFYTATQLTDPMTSWEDIRLWKMDLSGAFTLLDFDPNGVPFLATELKSEQESIAVFYLCGLFGWTAMPMAFQVVTRTIKWELSRPGVLRGLMDMYTDDMFGICLLRDLDHDMEAARAFCKGMLGSKSIEERKTEAGQRLTITGWDLDLNRLLVAISRKNALKAFYGFSSVNLEYPVEVKKVQAWSSWAERYGEICLLMRPFRCVLYRQIPHWARNPKGHSKRVFHIRLSDDAKRIVRLYSALLALTLLHETQFTRPFASFRVSAPSLVIKFDGCLSGSGVIWYGGMSALALQHDPLTRGLSALGGAAVDLRSLGFGEDSSFQNVSEFISLLLGVVGAIAMGWDISSVYFIGDSKAALTWAKEGRFRSNNVVNAATAMAMIGATRTFNVYGVQHVPKENNRACDTLSRRGHMEPWLPLVKKMTIRSEDVSYNNLEEVLIPALDSLLGMCDPRLSWACENEFVEHWKGMLDWVKSL